jgi:hypothetical protein
MQYGWERKNTTFRKENFEKKNNHPLDLGADGTTVQCISHTKGRCGLGSPGSGQGQVEGSWKHRNQPSGSIKCWEFDKLNNY